MGSLNPVQQGRTLKRGKVRETHMEQLNLDPPPESADDDIKAAFRELVMPDNPAQQIGAVEKLLAAATKSDECAKLCTLILVSSLLQLQFKAQLRTKISKFMSTIATKYQETYEENLIEVICGELSDPEKPVRIMQAVNLVVEDGSSIFSSQTEKSESDAVTSQRGGKECNETLLAKIHPHVLQGILIGITQLWCKHKEALSSVEATQVLQQVQQLVKNSTAYLQQHGSKNNIASVKELYSLLDQVVCVIEHPSCPLDLRINCGQLIAMIHKLCSKDGLDNLVWEVVNKDGQYAGLSPLAQLAVINGILCVSPGRELYSNVSCNDSYLGIEVLEAILGNTLQSNDGSMAISTIRMVQHWTLRTLEAKKSNACSNYLMSVLHPSSSLMASLLDYLWLSWDHFLDSVKHAAKDSFQNLIKIHVGLSPEDSQEYYTEMCKTLLIQPASRKYKLSAISCLVPVVGSQTLLTHDPQLPGILLALMKDSSMASHAAELVEALFTVHVREVSQREWQNIWLSVFLDSFCQEMQTFGYELLFKKLLLTCPESLDVVVATLSESADKLESEKLCLLIMCVKIGRQSVYWQKKCQEKNAERYADMWKFILPYKTIMLCLRHIDESVQMAAFSLLCESPKSTEMPEKQEMNLIIDYYYYNITNQSPSYKQHVIKSTKKLFHRIKEAVRLLLKSKNSDENSMNELNVFCKKLFMLMMQNLHVGANTARRGTSLLILELFKEILSPDCGTHLGIDELNHSQTYIDTLLYVLDDSYESNKTIAVKLLLAVPQDKLRTQDENKIECLVDAACDLASSCRPPDTLTASYVLKFLVNDPMAMKLFMRKFSDNEQSHNSLELFFKFLLKRLRKELKVAKSSLIKAAASGPMYGLLLCLRALLSDIPKDEFKRNHNIWKALIKEVLDICYKVSDLVAPIVRNSSPEGHLPMDLNPESLANLRAVLQASLGNQQCENDVQLSPESKPDELVKAQAVTAQMLLLCAWRSIKEISLILGDVVQRYPLYPDELSVLAVEDVITIGQYFLTQLSETKHRGAFEQSYLGFSRVCEQLWQCSEERLRSLPEKWLKEVLHAIQNNEDDRLCATRRSAGVPFIIQAILSSEPSVRGAVCLKSTMTTLLQLAGEQQYRGYDARIHALNILRALYRDTRLGDLIVPYAPTGVKAAITGYKSDSWAERNSSSILFASLITRMFGVKKTQDDLSRKNAMSALVFFRRYPELYDFLKSELESGAVGVKEGKLVPSLFPILLLLARLSPSPIEGRNSTLSIATFTPAVIQCTCSSVLQLRGLASHALIPLVTPDNVSEVINQLCGKASLANQNGLHGILLCLLKLVKYFHDIIIIKDDKSDSIVESIMSIAWSATEANRCLITRGCALELFTFLISKKLTSDVLPVLSGINSSTFVFVTSKDSTSSCQPWSALCQKAGAHYLLHFAQIAKSDIAELLCLLLSNSNYEVRLLCLNYMERLEDLPSPVMKKMLEQVQGEELNNECLIQSYHILNKFVTRGISELSTNFERGIALLNFCVEKAREEACMELLTEMLCFSSTLVALLLSKYPEVQFEAHFTHWLEMMVAHTGIENDIDVRIQVANGISSILPFLPSHPSIFGKAKLEVYEALITLLQDDSNDVQDIVALSVGKYLDHEELQSACQPTRILEIVCDVIAGTGNSEAISLLVKLALKEDTPEVFGLAQDDDRVFDKGEMNAHREDRTVAQAAVKSLSNALNLWSNSAHTQPTFLKQEIFPCLCNSLETQNDLESQEDLSLEALLKLLAKDIYYIYNLISSLETKAIFCVKNVEIWLVRLGCRSAVWKVLRSYYNIESDLVKSVVSNLNKSIIKGRHITEIIDDLS